MAEVNVYRDGKVHVRAEQCDHCLFGKGRLVPGSRARSLVASTRTEQGGSFVCHRNQVSDAPEAICAAWWHLYADEDMIMRLAKMADVVTYVKENNENGEAQ